MNIRSLGLFLASPLLSMGGLALIWGPFAIAVSNPAVPGPDVLKVGLILVLGTVAAVVGWVAGTRLEARAWQSTAASVGLTVEDGTGSLFRQPDLTGTADGRELRVGQRTRRRGSTGSGTKNQLYTHVEATIDPPTHEGVIVWKTTQSTGRGTGGPTELIDRLEDGDTATVIRDDQLVAVGQADMQTQAVVTGAARQRLLEAETLGAVWVGDASAAVGDVTAEISDVPFGKSMAEAYEDVMSHDPATVTNKGSKSLLYGDELEREVRAIVAVADAFDAARDSAEEYAQ